MKVSWKYIFWFHGYGSIYDARLAAKTAQYPYYSFNDRLYDTLDETYLERGLTKDIVSL